MAAKTENTPGNLFSVDVWRGGEKKKELIKRSLSHKLPLMERKLRNRFPYVRSRNVGDSYVIRELRLVPGRADGVVVFVDFVLLRRRTEVNRRCFAV